MVFLFLFFLNLFPSFYICFVGNVGFDSLQHYYCPRKKRRERINNLIAAFLCEVGVHKQGVTEKSLYEQSK